MASEPKSRPLPVAVAVGALPSWREPRLAGEHILWLETRPNEAGRTTVLRRAWGSAAPPSELTPP
ncbi:MAG: hypothetical protein ACK5QW_08545, partial [Cyanobacteriota bacterium]